MINNTRALLVLEAHRGGKSWRQIAEQYGFTKQRAQQLGAQGIAIEQQQSAANPWFELSVRIRNALVDTGCVPTPLGVAYHFHVGGLAQLLRVPSIGIKSRTELNAWLVKHGEEPICK
jgi:hypothetical protein